MNKLWNDNEVVASFEHSEEALERGLPGIEAVVEGLGKEAKLDLAHMFHSHVCFVVPAETTGQQKHSQRRKRFEEAQGAPDFTKKKDSACTWAYVQHRDDLLENGLDKVWLDVNR